MNLKKILFPFLIVVIISCRSTDTKNNIGGTYVFGTNVEEGRVGSVDIYPLTDSTALFFIDLCRGAPSYNLGQLFGQMTIKDSIGIYRASDFDCMLKFEFSSEQVKITTDKNLNDCPFGHAVYADNIYKRINKSIPKCFINGEGDTILFKGMTVEKYEHRFD